MNTETMNTETMNAESNTTLVNYKKPQYCYIREPSNAPTGQEKRFIAVAMSYTPDGTVKYGASIFRRDAKNEAIVKKNLRETARGRLEKRPIVFKLQNTNTFSYKDVVTEVRKTIHRQGVSSKTNQ